MTMALKQGSELLMEALAVSKQAGEAILGIYDKGFETSFKDDQSPLTSADTASHAVILRGLRALTPELPVFSEESESIAYATRRLWKEYWLVDPLDGTKEFIKRNGEFTVNIALIRECRPVLGVVYAPALGVAYFARQGQGAFKQGKSGEISPIAVDQDTGRGLNIVASRSHQGQEDAFLKRLGAHTCLNMGSSLKFCLVAEGRAHLYPRFLPTSEWDTAAAQCVAEEAGAAVTDLQGQRLLYNKENLLNPFFVASSLPKEQWMQAL